MEKIAGEMNVEQNAIKTHKINNNTTERNNNKNVKWIEKRKKKVWKRAIEQKAEIQKKSICARYGKNNKFLLQLVLCMSFVIIFSCNQTEKKVSHFIRSLFFHRRVCLFGVDYLLMLMD